MKWKTMSIKNKLTEELKIRLKQMEEMLKQTTLELEEEKEKNKEILKESKATKEELTTELNRLKCRECRG